MAEASSGGCAVCGREGERVARHGMGVCRFCVDGDPSEALATHGIEVDHTCEMTVVQALTELYSVWRFEMWMDLPVPVPVEVTFRREGTTDRLLRLLRIRSEVQTGEPDFDAAVWVQAEESHPFLRDRGVHSAVLAAFEAGADEIRLGGRSLILRHDRPAGTVTKHVRHEYTDSYAVYNQGYEPPPWRLVGAILALHVLRSAEGAPEAEVSDPGR